MMVSRILGWTSVGLLGAVSLAWMTVCCVILGVALIWTAGVLVPLAAVRSISGGCR